jgi:23S rRNA (adenine2030-N6)-methyltransferase
MNYRHAYHVGNFADVLKHIVLLLCLEHLKKKPAPFRVVDTHAGVGHYVLNALETTRTGEWQAGIARVLTAIKHAPPKVQTALEPYLALVRRDSASDGTLKAYPGSPTLAAASLRKGDTLIANELHPDDNARLKAVFTHDRHVKVMALDGYTALRSLLPPPERRGLVLVDPPFEEPGELIRMTEGLDASLARFKTGIYILWHPIKDPKPVERFRREVTAVCERHGVETTWAIELLLRAPRHPDVLSGCGLIVVNAPYTLGEPLDVILPWLARTLGETREAAASAWKLGV